MLHELIATEGVIEHSMLRGRVGVMALHGGLEVGTSFAARRCAELSGASLYAVDQPADFRWHVPSTRFDPAQSAKLEAFLEHVKVVVSFHGFGRRGLESTVLVGGTNGPLRRRLAEAIAHRTELRVIADTERIPRGLRGVHPRNPVNLPEFGGAQIELSPQARMGGALEGVAASVSAVLVSESSEVCGRSGRR